MPTSKDTQGMMIEEISRGIVCASPFSRRDSTDSTHRKTHLDTSPLKKKEQKQGNNVTNPVLILLSLVLLQQLCFSLASHLVSGELELLLLVPDNGQTSQMQRGRMRKGRTVGVQGDPRATLSNTYTRKSGKLYVTAIASSPSH